MNLIELAKGRFEQKKDLNVKEFLTFLPKMKTRTYSITNDPVTSPNIIRICFIIENFANNNLLDDFYFTKKGVASNYLIRMLEKEV
jgi:sulfite reductase alpha subunit-like flavoprotein